MEAPSKKLALGRVLWGVVVVIILAGFAVAGYYLAQRYTHTEHPFPGSLILSFPAPWKSPDKETLTGLVTYIPTKSSFFGMTIPQPGVIFSYMNGSISSDGTKLLVTQVSATSSALAVYSIPLQHVSAVLDRESVGTQFFSMNWSSDGSKVSYAAFPSVTPKTLAADGKPFLTLQDGKYVQRTGAQLAPSSLPSSYVISIDGSHKLSLGNLQPGIFSPDGTMVFIEGGFGPIIETIADGTQRNITRPTDGTFPAGLVTLTYDPNGKYVGVLGKVGPLVVYEIDWKNAKLIHVGTTSNRPIAEVFGANDQLLTFEGTSKQAVTYSFAASSTSMARQAYSLTLPSTAQLLGWVPAP